MSDSLLWDQSMSEPTCFPNEGIDQAAAASA